MQPYQAMENTWSRAHDELLSSSNLSSTANSAPASGQDRPTQAKRPIEPGVADAWRRGPTTEADPRNTAGLLDRIGLREAMRAVYRIASPFLPISLHRAVWNYLLFFRDLWRYQSMPGAESMGWIDLYPCLYDRHRTTPLDLNYFLQDTWAAKKIFQARPKFHVDIGSTALLVGILSQFTRVCSVDIRPLDVELPGLEVRAGSIVALPFGDGSLESVSSLCVIEHIGLGRYGDPLDPRGTDRAAAELQRVLSPGGNLYISVPVSAKPRVFFNAHRSFRHEDILAKFSALTVREVVFIQWGKRYSLEEFGKIPFDKKEVVGLYHFSRA